MRSREVIQLIEADGWYQVDVKGSHHQFRHPTKRGRVTVPHPRSELPQGHSTQHLEAGWLGSSQRHCQHEHQRR
nr:MULTISPECIES: type II toxin-antitoxin system HicA family toxin [unclassified Pseudomonas]